MRGPKRWQLALKVALSLGLIGWLLLRSDGAEVVRNVQRLSPAAVLGAWACYGACQLLCSYRWQLFLRARGTHVPVRSLFGYYLIGMFLNNFLPSAVGGDVVKAGYLYRRTGRMGEAAASVFLERFTGLLGLGLASVVALALAHGLLAWTAFAAVVGTAALLALLGVLLWWGPAEGAVKAVVRGLLPGRVADRAQAAYAAVAIYRHDRPVPAGAVALSAVIHVLYAFFYSLVASSLGRPIDATYFLLFLPLVNLVTMLPISVGGLGVREALLVFLFADVGVPAADVLSVSLTAYALNTLLSVTGGLLLLVHGPARGAAGPALEVARDA
jgi:uncharacterized protein (TIRG00374 family)